MNTVSVRHVIENFESGVSSTSRGIFLLTRMEASCEYVAGHSLVFPIVRKNRLNKLNTSASVVSRRLA